MFLERELIIDDATSFIVPILLDKGLLAPSPEGRGFSIGLLLRIVKTSKASLKDHLIRLVSVLVESMSAMEPRSLQYMEFHTERLNISSSELESTRLKISQLSPLQDALDVCLESLASPSCIGILPEVISNLSLQAQQGIGLATRVAAVRSLLFLMNSCPTTWNLPSVQRCFHSLMISLFPNPPTSESLRKDILIAIGTLAKMCNSSFLSEEIMKLIALYNDLRPENFILPKVIADCMCQIVTKSGELFQQEREIWKELILCSYIGSFEENSDVQSSWSQLFSEVVIQSGYGTRESSLKSVLTRIFQTISSLLAALSWNKRTQGLAALNEIISLFPSGILAPNCASVVLSILKVIPGQMWKGKENALKSFALLLEKCPQCIDDQNHSSDFFSCYPHSDPCQNYTLIRLEDTESRAGLLEKINERLDTLLRNENLEIPPTIPGEDLKLPSNMGWRVSWSSAIRFLLNESSKGDRQYRLLSASSLLLLPWNQMHSSHALETTLPLLEEISIRAGVSPMVDPLEYPPNGTSNTKMKSPPEQQDLPTKHHIDIFGGRYGQDFQSNKKLKRVKEIVSYEKEMENLEEMKGEDSSSTATGTPSSSNMSETSLRDQTDPAYRLKYLECLAKLWPSQQLDCLDASRLHTHGIPKWSSFSPFIPYFITWAYRIYKIEVWSIRKGILNVLTSFASYTFLVEEDIATLEMMLEILSDTSSDPKYSQIRLASSQVMEQLLSSTSISTMSMTSSKENLLTSSNIAHQITRILANLSLDTTPTVIFHTSKANQEWNKIKRERRLSSDI